MSLNKDKKKLSDNEKAILWILEDLGLASTAEIIEEVLDLPNNCKDKVPSILISLEKKKFITKKISKEKRGIVWVVNQNSDND
jgi:predicted transcriptional regulator